MKCKDGGTCGIGGYCKKCPHVKTTKPKAPPKTGWLVWDANESILESVCCPTRWYAGDVKATLNIRHSFEGCKWKISKVRITVIK
jgi:hypothetical protein